MKKTLFTIIACCIAVVSAFGQQFSFQLNEDNPQAQEAFYDVFNKEIGRIFIKAIGEPDDLGRTRVQIKLENNSNTYEFLLFDRDWSKKELRKQFIVLKFFNNSKGIQNVTINNKGGTDVIERNGEYIFPDIFVGEGKEYKCTIPIHLAKPKPGLFCKKRKILDDIKECSISIMVDNKDEVYEGLKSKNDSIFDAFNDAWDNKVFCTNPRHNPPFAEQTWEYLVAYYELRDKIWNHRDSCQIESKKYQRYDDLANLITNRIEEMNEDLAEYNHDCGNHKPTQATSCKYCPLSLQEIWTRMQNLYFKLRGGEMQKPEALKEARSLYNCCSSHKTQVRQWKSSENSNLKKGIEDYYNGIKNY